MQKKLDSKIPPHHPGTRPNSNPTRFSDDFRIGQIHWSKSCVSENSFNTATMNSLTLDRLRHVKAYNPYLGSQVKIDQTGKKPGGIYTLITTTNRNNVQVGSVLKVYSIPPSRFLAPFYTAHKDSVPKKNWF